MRHLLLLIFVLCMASAGAWAQVDTITIKKKALGTVFEFKGKTLSLKRLEKMVAKDAEATAIYRKGKNNGTVASIFSFAGGFVIGYDLGRAIGSNTKMDGATVGVGVGLIAIGVPFSIIAQKHLKNSVRTYNANKRKTACLHFEPDLYLGFTANGIGLRVRF